MRPVARADATQEIDAADVLEVSALEPSPAGRSVTNARASVKLNANAPWEDISFPSLAAVGMDLNQGRFDETCEIRLEARRKKLSRYVIAAVAASCVILVLSVVKHEPSTATHAVAAKAVAPAPPASVSRPATVASRSTPIPIAIPAPPPASTPVSVSPAAGSQPSSGGVGNAGSTGTSGTVRFVSPARSGWIWLDGNRLTGTSAIVSCGTHQVKVGYAAKHAITVPCDGEVVVKR